MKAKKSINEETIQNPIEEEEMKKQTLKFIEIKENIEKASISDKSSEENEGGIAEEHNLFEFQRCLEVDDNFGEFQYLE